MTSRRVTEPELITLVGDTLLVDGEPVADLRPTARASLRERLRALLEAAVARAPYERDEAE